MKIAIVGAGLIGTERIEAIQHLAAADGSIELSYVVDHSETIRQRVKGKYRTHTAADLEAALSAHPDWIFICTPHDVAPELAIRALESGANVLIEKPIGRTLAECDAIIAAMSPQTKLNVGFNYRFFSGIEAAILDAKAGHFGKLISVNFTLGHGNSPGMENSWKLSAARCGGGCLIDPGVHLLDLILELAQGEVSVSAARIWDGFWNTGIEEEAHILLADETPTIFNLDISLVRWRSTFRLEINGVDGYAIVEGRGRSYGPQTYRRGKRWGWQDGVSQAESEEVVVDSDVCSDSFVRETALVLGMGGPIMAPSLQPADHMQARRVMDLLSRIQGIMR